MPRAYIAGTAATRPQMIHVCSLARVPEVASEIGASHVITLLRDVDLIVRPPSVAPDNHLIIHVDDITCPIDGYTHPCEEHIGELIDFVQTWDRAAPLLVHCYAGISRSTAAAFTAACALQPQRDETEIAQALRRASPTATPNALIVSLADRVLGRRGRMVEAVQMIGRGAEAYEGRPFCLQMD
jgi:predicted protein tyrosine phosphatase